jgi:ABC-type multidrug transport system fused ATPase/permease subunit
MIRLLQLVLGILIFYFLYLTVISTAVVLPMMIKRVDKEPTSLKGVTYSLRRESFFIPRADLKFSKVYQYDSVNHGGKLQTFIEALNMKPSMLINDTPYAINKAAEPLKLEYNRENGALKVPVSVSTFNTILFSFIALMVAYLIFVIFLSFQLYHFARLAGRKEFFVRKNMARLRLLGAFLIVSACVGYFFESSRQWILEWLTGTWGYQSTGTATVIGFPSVPIAGLLMFIIAEAFSKGQELQTEQEYTI